MPHCTPEYVCSPEYSNLNPGYEMINLYPAHVFRVIYADSSPRPDREKPGPWPLGHDL